MKKYAKLMKINGSIAIILPREIEREVGISINSPVSVEVNRNRIIANVEISKVEMDVIKKLLNYKFEERTRKLIDESFTPAQKKILQDLIKRKVVMVYKSEKYKEEVYSVPKKIYDILINFGIVKKTEKEKEEKEGEKEEKEEKKLEKKLIDVLLEKGYLVLENEQEANEVSEALRKKIKEKKISSTEFMGIKGFDKKYYMIKRSLLSKYAPKVIEALKSGEKKFEEIQKITKIEKDLLASIIAMLNEEGEIIEKRKRVFSLA
jgi:antitoxin component of MazEF toxin-antitoxin module